MRRISRYLHRHFAPHHETGEKALALRHEALLLYSLFLFLLQFGLHFTAARFPGVLGFASNIAVEEIISLTNKERIRNGLIALEVDPKLTGAASEKAAYMFAKSYWAHTAPDGTTPWFFIQKEKYHYLYAGENLAKDFQNSSAVVEAWMASKIGHRENILNGNYSDMGVAVVNGVLNGFETTLVVQMFGSERSVAGVVAASAPTENKVEEKPVALQGPPSRKEFLSPGVPPLPLPQNAYVQAIQPRLPVVDIVSLGKSVSYTFGFFLLGLFVVDSVVIARKRLVRVSSHSTAHIMIVILLLATTWLISPGTIR